MLDLTVLCENLELVKEGVKNKDEKVDLDRLVSLDSKSREILRDVEQLIKPAQYEFATHCQALFGRPIAIGFIL